MLTTQDPSDILEAVMDSKILTLTEQRRPSSPYDFGDSLTVGLCLKRKYKSLQEMDIDKDYAIYLGEQSRGWVVAIKERLWWGFTGLEVYPTLADLQSEWMLD